MRKKLVILLAVILTLSMFISCASQESTDGGVQNEDKVSEENKDPGKKPVVGFANIAETAPQHIIIKESMERAAEAKGYELIYMNNKLDGQVAVSNADSMLLRGIDVFIEFNVDASVAPTIMEKMNDANVPVIAVDIHHPGAVYFGADNYGVGPIVGEYLANLVKEKWDQQPDALLIIEDPISGEIVLARTDNIIDGYRKVDPDFPDDKVFYIDGGQDVETAQRRVADFLSSHPNFERIAIAPAHSTYRIGASAAIETANRQKQCLMVSQGEYDYIEYIQNNPDEPEWEVYAATVVYNFKRYGDYCMDIVEKLLAGEQVEEEYYADHYMIDRSNVYTEFPEEFD